MDSVTQFVLGAAVGGAVLGKKAGNRAVIWGGIVGTVPDLDVFFLPFMNESARLHFHRGISHSIVFNLLLAPLLGFVLYRINRKKESLKEWIFFSYATLFSAVLLDCFTVYGTHIFKPFSDYRAAFNNISIIDPVYTLPLFISVLMSFFIKSSSRAKHKVILWGLAFSTVYMLLTFGAKLQINSIVEQNIFEKKIQSKRFMTAPTLFNALLWRATIEVEKGYLVGYYSFLDKSRNIDLRFVKRNDELLEKFSGAHELNTLLWFSKGWYRVSFCQDDPDNKNRLEFSDIRFGEIHTDFNKKGVSVFTWKIERTDDEVFIKRKRPETSGIKVFLMALIKRIKGI